jgi:hypothetical protein
MKDECLDYIKEYILKTRKEKFGYNYNFSNKNINQIADLLNHLSIAEILAAWDVYLGDYNNEVMKFWGKGHTVDSFADNRCFSLLQENYLYKTFIDNHSQK